MKNTSFILSMALFAGLTSLPHTGKAATWDERNPPDGNGQLSTNHLAPTPFPATHGSNTISGYVIANQKYLTFTVPAGHVLSSVKLDSYYNDAGASAVSFFAIAAGANVSVPPPGSNPLPPGNNILGHLLFKGSNIGSNLLPAMASGGSGAPGFTPPLPPGTYTFWIQDTVQYVEYSFSFDITPGTGGAAAKRMAKESEVATLDKAYKKAKKTYKKVKTKKNYLKLKKANTKLKTAKTQLGALPAY